MKKAFTLVELLVVISIIALTSIVGISSFFGFVEEQAINARIESFKDDIKVLDRQIKNRELFDYKITLTKDKNYYIVDKNSFDIDKKIILQNGEISLKDGGEDETFGLKVYKGQKLFATKTDLKTYNISLLTTDYNYRFIGIYNNTEINTLEIKNFETTEHTLHISEIQPNPLIIQNILGKKSFLDNSGAEVSEIAITFEKDGKEGSLEIAN